MTAPTRLPVQTWPRKPSASAPRSSRGGGEEGGKLGEGLRRELRGGAWRRMGPAAFRDAVSTCTRQPLAHRP